ncbi:ribbon-helix-helix domain-containing protein [Ferrovibrio sp.]|uniref:ribbon-helix-helix domain-containing protein n=1 Tax=Ferrovibrio sp. TaxID=1917215 RepID=UPI000CC0AFE2|nr:ribbon-helix-helix domain-containing protein [Ferrovibrio sp.]PJI39052.1 MAG: aryl-sulfate sulfotransferase [Ferrovibrio sp.]
MPTTVKKRSVVVGGHRTSISLEQAFWEALQLMAATEDKTINQMVSDIDAARSGNLSSAIRVWILDRAKEGLLQSTGTAARADLPAGKQEQ